MTFNLSEEEVRLRLIEWNNLKRLHAQQKETILKQKEIIKLLNNENFKLRNLVLMLQQSLEDLKFQFNQMKEIVFGKKRKMDRDEDDEPRPPIERTRESYKRPVPKASEVTHTVVHDLPKSNSPQRTKTFYVEDIPLNFKKIVTKYQVTQEKINNCWVGDIDIPNTEVTIGENVIILINTLTVEQRLSYSQIQNLLKLFFNFHISQGEITNIIYRESQILTPVYEKFKEEIQKESSQHLDETGWNVHKERNFAWSMTGGDSNSTVYKLGVSRGKGYAEELLNLTSKEQLKSVLVSDDYPAYKNLSENHQLCWAHPLRKWRDLSKYPEFKELLKSQYLELKNIFQELKENLHTSKLKYFTKKLCKFSTILNTDPEPIIRLKKTFKINISKYLTCLKFPNIQLTNNTAERSLRSLVIKRRISFGSNSQRGADALSITFTVIKELFRTNPDNFFEAYRKLRV